MEGNSLDSSNGGLVHTFDADGGDFIKPGATVVGADNDNKVSGLLRRRFSHKSGTGSGDPSPPRRVEAMADDAPMPPFPKGGQSLLGQLRLFMFGRRC